MEAAPSPLQVGASVCATVVGIVALFLLIVWWTRRGGGCDAIRDDFAKASFLQAVEWEEVGKKATVPCEKVVALVRASAYLNASRLGMKDDAIEAVVKQDVSAVARRIEQAELAAVRAVDANAEPFAATRLIR